MTTPSDSTVGRGGVQGSTFHGPAALLVGQGTQHVQFVHQWKPAYRIEDFPAEPRDLSTRMLAEQPSRLLRAAHQVVPFTGRRHDLDRLTDWREDPATRLGVRLLHGPGGQGKTRLAAHFAELSRRAGWTVWQAVLNEAEAEPVDTGPLPRAAVGILLVVDYAERWPMSDLHRLLREPLPHRTRLPVRVLLLARPAGIWWESLETWIGDTLDVPADTHPLSPLAQDASERVARFNEARDHFAEHLGLPSEEAGQIRPPVDLGTDEDYAQVLTVHIAALAAVDAHLHHDIAPVDPARASAYLLKRERAHWGALHRRSSSPLTTTPEAMGRTVLTATLTRSLARSHGQNALHRVGLADSVADANTLLDDHRFCYPSPHGSAARTAIVLEPLHPDRLGEDFLGLSTPADPHDSAGTHPVSGAVTDDWAHGVAARLLAPTGTVEPWTRDALTVLIETARRWPHIATGQLRPLLLDHPELALQAGGTALVALADLDALDITVLEAIEPHLPSGRHADLDVGIAAVVARVARHRLATDNDPVARAHTQDTLAVRRHHAGLRDEALVSGRHAVRAWRDLTRADAAHRPSLAGSLCDLGAYLSAVGRRAEALSAVEEAVEIRRRLVADDPVAHEPGLALSLSALAHRLFDRGRRSEALSAIEKAVEIRRRLVRENPVAHEPALAASLSSLGASLSDVGRRHEALAVTEEAVEILRRLTANDPAVYGPDLADTLSNLGNRLSAVGREAEAVSAIEEAVTAYRRLVAANPAAYEADLALALSNLGPLLLKAGRQREAMSVTEEAVGVRRRLAEQNPAAYESDLAASLSNLGSLLSEAERWQEALAPEQEAVGIRRRLAEEDPAAHEPGLAVSLSNLGVQLLRVGRGQEALSVSEEAVEIRRRLAEDGPAAYAPDLAASLTNLGTVLSETGRRQEALSARVEAVGVHRRLALGDPATHEPGLTVSLTALGVLLGQLGRWEEAIAAEREAVDIRRRLAVGEPAVYEPDLAVSLFNLGVSLREAGRQPEALSATEEAVDIRRRLVRESPAAHESDLAGSLRNLGALSAAVGRRGEALSATEEAVAMHRRPAAADPAAHESDLVDSLSNLGSLLYEAGRRREALSVLAEAVAVSRRLALGNPAAYEPVLARSLFAWAQVSHAARQGASAALRATAEAVEIYRRHAAAGLGRFPVPLGSVLDLQARLLLGLGRPREAEAIRRWIEANGETTGARPA